ncbi:MAG: phosphoribosylglycinamide formyltransferase [Bacteroidetes bacterium]|nr:phosphoribosylglycinamide formyltransferase [Bacteroidota bacterium]
MIRIAILASGSGTNARRITEYFREHDSGISVGLILSNNPGAFVLERAKNLGVPTIVFSRSEFYETEKILELLRDNGIDALILAGFLWLVPAYLLKAYPGRILNIHPALLPKYGGKGMYGMKVHEAVIAAGEKESGISIHLVNEKYDDGNIIFQSCCPVEPGDTPETLAQRIHLLEYEHYPRVIGQYLCK